MKKSYPKAGFGDFLAELPSEWAYNTVGTYDDGELFTLIGLVVDKQNISAKDTQFAFGKWVFKELFLLSKRGRNGIPTNGQSDLLRQSN